MAIGIKLQPDFREVDATMGRIMAALNPKMINSLTSRVARKQVKEKYAERFRKQTDDSSNWQQMKKAAALGEGEFLYGPEPGFLTGTTFRSITAKSNENSGNVFLNGMWPQGSGQVSQRDEAGHILACFKWSVEGLAFLFSGMAFEKYPKSQSLDSIDYTSEGGREIEWMYLDEQDVDIVSKSVENLMIAAVENNPGLTKSLFSWTKLADEGPKPAPLDSAARDVWAKGAVTETPEEALIKMEGIEDKLARKNMEKAGYNIAEEMKRYGVSSIADLIRKLRG